jgi:TPR repeat protein
MKLKYEKTMIESNKNLDEISEQANNAYLQRDFENLFSLTEVLINSQNLAYASSGYILLGGYYEYFNDSSDNLLRAVEQYRNAAELKPAPADYVAIARALIKAGQEYYPEALESLNKGATIGSIPEIDLGFAYIYLRRNPPDYKLAKSFFLKAARYGRVQGLFGYSYAARKLGQNFRAMLIDIYRVVSSPFIYLFIGKKIVKGFSTTFEK